MKLPPHQLGFLKPEDTQAAYQEKQPIPLSLRTIGTAKRR